MKVPQQTTSAKSARRMA